MENSKMVRRERARKDRKMRYGNEGWLYHFIGWLHDHGLKRLAYWLYERGYEDMEV